MISMSGALARLQEADLRYFCKTLRRIPDRWFWKLKKSRLGIFKLGKMCYTI